MAKKNDITFDQSLKELEGIVKQLESGDIPLEDAIELYKKGMILSKQCNEKLNVAEQKVQQITLENQTLVFQPMKDKEGELC
ncbi:exodeoxyribonuclease VII small subunit [Desulfuribacillus stibiiarsenatis]|uniref:Exodeoxyribonuclease 7 small subunit n=1 Tax=Desulfuribacillus stibiiarsenatis TaxID=1390249 RepID=A0A1E5L687_9FIRM|nr:exodeoxyribonuclease VII small subunit [Desulfuribacillus stibiiarsenatis]OEH85667.1 exodeoxyribonuclease VII small subunit [Desulfuribacillus stibiiarsenatis]